MLLTFVKSSSDDIGQMADMIQANPPSAETLGRCLWAACKRGKGKMAAALIDRGADVTKTNFYNRTLLMMTMYAKFECDREQMQLAVLLVQRGVDPTARDAENKQALDLAVQFDRIAMVGWLAGFHDAAELSEALTLAVQYNNLPMARKLVACGADVNFRSATGIFPIVVATVKQNYEIISFLAHQGADVNSAVLSGATPLHFAARLPIIVLTLLLQKGANVAARTGQKNTPLHYAVDDGRLDNVKMLLGHGSDPNAQNERGETPLMLACRGSKHKYGGFTVGLVSTLLAAGADPNLTDFCASSTFNQVAMNATAGMFNVIDFLQAYGGNINSPNGVHPLALLCSSHPKVTFDQILGMILRGASLRASGWFEYLTYAPTLLKLGVWSLSCKRAAVAYYFTFVYGEEKGVRPVPVPRRLTGAAGLYPIRRRLAAYLVHDKRSVRYMVQQIVEQF
jgi:ankyrin repeat protein